jgi:hypothetical protein
VEQLLLHLIGDYVFQTDWMARGKTQAALPALIHATTYTILFWFLTDSWIALSVICLTHYLIDRYRLARYVIYFRERLSDPRTCWGFCKETGYTVGVPEFIAHKYPPKKPLWLATMLLIITDNALHLCINYGALRWL